MHSTLNLDQIWQEFSALDPATAHIIADTISTHKSTLVEVFYSTLQTVDDAQPFITATTLEIRLKPGLERWLESMFCNASYENFKVVMAMQKQIGEVHSRAEIPINLVLMGMRTLKKAINLLLRQTELSREQLCDAVLYVDQLFDIAFELMTIVYTDKKEQGIRVDESFRFFSATHNIAMEREKQQGALLKWENQLLLMIANESVNKNFRPLVSSAFGMWIRHKAPFIFGETQELPLVEASIKSVDEAILPQITSTALGRHADTNVLRHLMNVILSETDQIKYLLNVIFDRLSDMEVGRDVLTQLYNRRFMPTILKRELELSRNRNTPFCILMVDIDNFKLVNDEYGHEAGDHVLQQVATVMMNKVRAGDFAFRYGGEEFLMLLTEVADKQGMLIAEKIRESVAATNILLSRGRSIQVTISIGAAISDGHPDYARLIERADQALYQAKNAGRNCCKLDGDG